MGLWGDILVDEKKIGLPKTGKKKDLESVRKLERYRPLSESCF
jgi:hypothetical protein